MSGHPEDARGRLQRTLLPLTALLVLGGLFYGLLIAEPVIGLADNDDFGARTDSFLEFDVLADGDYFALVFASGGAADDSLYHALGGRASELHCIGDAYQARDIEVAVVDGHRVGRAL